MTGHEDGYAPAIRFSEFKDNWESKCVADIAPLQRGFDLPTGKVVPGQFPVAYSNGVLRFHGEYKCEGPGVITGRSGTIGKVTFIEGNYWPHNTALWVTNFFNNDPQFIHYFYVNFRLDRFNAGSTVPTLNRNDVHAIRACIPSPEEQKDIGKYFKALDQLIALQQRKHDKLVTLKQAMLQKMFPKDGASTPEIRFKGFEGEWTEKQLARVVDVCSGRDYKHLAKGDILVYGTGGYMLSVSEALSYDRDAVGIGRKGTIDKPFLLKAPFWTVDTLFYAVPKLGYHLDFVFSIFQKVDWKNKDESTGVPSLSKGAINEIFVQVPGEDEQQRIGTYCRQLDNLISQHATQLSKLKQIKAACLEKMFV